MTSHLMNANSFLLIRRRQRYRWDNGTHFDIRLGTYVDRARSEAIFYRRWFGAIQDGWVIEK